MNFRNLPTDIDAEVILDYYPKGTFDVKFKGHHKRNAYNDLLNIEDNGERMRMTLNRNSLYNALPEFLFHPSDRFDLPQYNKKERFAEEYAKQEIEKEKAYRFFEPVDLALLHHRILARHEMNDLTEENKVLTDILSDSIEQKHRENRFIKRSLEFLPYCKIIRGDKTLITLMLRKVFMEEGLVINVSNQEMTHIDPVPRYGSEMNSKLSSAYLGNEFEQNTLCFNVIYWAEQECNDGFNQFVNEVETYRKFVQDYFFSVEAILIFNIQTDSPMTRMPDINQYYYLNHNTNI